MKVIDLDSANEHLYLVCLEEWSEWMGKVRDIKEAWYRQMIGKGLKVKIALDDDGVVAGMIEYMPIEYSYARGCDLYMVNCMWVHGYEDKGIGDRQGRGMGTALLEAAEEDVRSMDVKGLAAWGIAERFWMSASWYERNGYKKADTMGGLVLMWKAFTDDAEAPAWIKGTFEQDLVPGKVKVTSFLSRQCPSANAAHERARIAVGEFGDDVIFEEIDMSVAENREKYGLSGGMYVNGEDIFTGPPPSLDEIRSKIGEKLAQVRH
jgi:GNAT superfamily N-acetyltransferase